MSSLADQGRALLRDQLWILAHRRQSKAFLRGEQLAAIPLVFASKIQLSEPVEITHWDDLDAPTVCNFAALFPARQPGRTLVEIDVDCKPVGGDPAWTEELETAAGFLAQLILETLIAVGGLDGRHKWGRKSQKGWGHLYIPVQTVDKAGTNRLLGLTMRKPIRVGALNFRIEVRVAPDKKDAAKGFTLPGSVYSLRSRDGFDPIIWRTSVADLAPQQAFPALEPQPLARLVKGLWAGLLAALLSPHWLPGNRHEPALILAGVLAREATDAQGLLDREEARRFLTGLCTAFADDDLPDRLAALDSTFATLESGRPVTGYARLGELIGDDAKLALLRIRGGADPDVLASLFEKVAYANIALGKESVYLDLSTHGHGAIICTREAIRSHFHPHPHYPPIANGKKAVPLIDIVLASSQRQAYHAAVSLPGVPFRSILLRDNDGYRIANEAEALDPSLPRLLNIGTGWATATVEEPEPEAWKRWYTLWRRHLQPLTRGDPAAIAKLEQTIAWAVQHPLEKVPLGLCLTGDGGIGKSVLFHKILAAILGRNLFDKVNIKTFETPYALQDLEGRLFFVVEEVNLSQTKEDLKETFKDLMKNDRMKINRKYGGHGDIDNFAIPIFLTNEPHPGLVVQGRRERSLMLIMGETREHRAVDQKTWDHYVETIAVDVQEFLTALEEQAIREAGLYYFQTLTVTRAALLDNSVIQDVADPRERLTPIDEAIIAIIEANAVHPRLPFPLTAPFKITWLSAALNQRIRDRGHSRRQLTDHSVTARMREILGREVFIDYQFRDDSGKKRYLKHIAVKYGDIVRRAEKFFDLTLEPAYELEEGDFGANTISPEECRKHYEISLETGLTSY